MRYEYKIIRRIKNTEKQLEELNELGSQRWKVVVIRSTKIYLIREKRGD